MSEASNPTERRTGGNTPEEKIVICYPEYLEAAQRNEQLRSEFHEMIESVYHPK